MARQYLDDLGVDALDQRLVGGGADGVADGAWIGRAVRYDRDSAEPQQRSAAVLGRVQTFANRAQALANQQVGDTAEGGAENVAQVAEQEGREALHRLK